MQHGYYLCIDHEWLWIPIVLSEIQYIHTERLYEKLYILCGKSNMIQIDNKSQKRLCCLAVWCLMLLTLKHSHAYTNRRENGAPTHNGVWLSTSASAKCQRKAVSCSPRVCIGNEFQVWAYWNIWFTGCVTAESGGELKRDQTCVFHLSRSSRNITEKRNTVHVLSPIRVMFTEVLALWRHSHPRQDRRIIRIENYSWHSWPIGIRLRSISLLMDP